MNRNTYAHRLEALEASTRRGGSPHCRVFLARTLPAQQPDRYARPASALARQLQESNFAHASQCQRRGPGGFRRTRRRCRPVSKLLSNVVAVVV